MKKISLEEKNKQPKLYGYPSSDYIDGNWVSYYDADGDLRYIPCTYEFYKFYHNQQRLERKKKLDESRCLIDSKRYKGLVKCRYDCNQCPYKKEYRTGSNLSLGQMAEDGIEIEDKKGEFNFDIYDINIEISKLKIIDQEIMKLFSLFKTDVEIAKCLNLSANCVKIRREKCIRKLKEKLLEKK